MITADQTQRIWKICEAWTRMRDGSREPATVAEVIEFLITQEEIALEEMAAAEAEETRAA